MALVANAGVMVTGRVGRVKGGLAAAGVGGVKMVAEKSADGRP